MLQNWEDEQRRLHANPPDFYTTPADKNKCRNYQQRRPGVAVPCWHPHCSCMEAKVDEYKVYWEKPVWNTCDKHKLLYKQSYCPHCFSEELAAEDRRSVKRWRVGWYILAGWVMVLSGIALIIHSHG